MTSSNLIWLKPTPLATSIASAVRRLRLFNQFAGFGMRHILAVAIAIGAFISIGAIEACSVALAFLCRVVLFVVLVFLFAGIWVGCIILSRLRFPQRFTGKFISHSSKDKCKS
jgi:hypothetical protein